MTQTIQFKGWITFEDAMRVERLLIPRKYWSFSGITTIALLAAIAVTVMSIQTSFLFTILFLVITGGFFGTLFWLMHKSSLKAKRKHYNRNLIERSGTLTADEIAVTTDHTKTELKWDFFDKVIITDNLVLVAKDKDYMAFAPHMFSTQQEWESCKALVSGREKKPQADRVYGSSEADESRRMK
jgi:hypothetical protein